MAEEISLATFHETIRKLGEDFYRSVKDQMAAEPWTLATLDVRYRPEGSFLDKIRVATSNDPAKSLGTTDEMSYALIVLRGMRRIFPREWFGLKLTVDPERHVTVDFSYDPKWADDSTFFDD